MSMGEKNLMMREGGRERYESHQRDFTQRCDAVSRPEGQRADSLFPSAELLWYQISIYLTHTRIRNTDFLEAEMFTCISCNRNTVVYLPGLCVALWRCNRNTANTGTIARSRRTQLAQCYSTLEEGRGQYQRRHCSEASAAHWHHCCSWCGRS